MYLLKLIYYVMISWPPLKIDIIYERSLRVSRIFENSFWAGFSNKTVFCHRKISKNSLRTYVKSSLYGHRPVFFSFFNKYLSYKIIAKMSNLLENIISNWPPWGLKSAKKRAVLKILVKKLISVFWKFSKGYVWKRLCQLNCFLLMK